MDTTSKILLRAAELIAERGWAQGSLRADDESMCALVAIANADETGTQRYAAYGVLLKLLPDGRVANWNDAPERTAEEVIDTLIAAAYWEDDE
jgi:hypothetical protein